MYFYESNRLFFFFFFRRLPGSKKPNQENSSLNQSRNFKVSVKGMVSQVKSLNKIVAMSVFLFTLAAANTIEDSTDFQYDFYKTSCPDAETIVLSVMKKILSQPENKNAPPQLLRLLFHDCFIEGCDASVLLKDNNGTAKSEQDAIPNFTLKGFHYIDMIKSELEERCPGIVSCADIVALATRDGILLSGGPYFPVLTGRRDSNTSYFSEALTEIPQPNGNISEILRLFFLRGFDEREIVALLGGHSIGKISCDFIKPRLSNFLGTGLPDPTITSDMIEQMRLKCLESNSSVSNTDPSLISKGLFEPDKSMSYYQGRLFSFSPLPTESPFGTHYFKSLVRGRGLLFSDQQLMANEETAKAVLYYAGEDDGTSFRKDFARVMIKLSNLGVLTGSQGQVRLNCSVALRSA